MAAAAIKTDCDHPLTTTTTTYCYSDSSAVTLVLNLYRYKDLMLRKRNKIWRNDSRDVQAADIYFGDDAGDIVTARSPDVVMMRWRLLRRDGAKQYGALAIGRAPGIRSMQNSTSRT
nr:hypothetical protein [Tanacetum cinerariifolium]